MEDENLTNVEGDVVAVSENQVNEQTMDQSTTGMMPAPEPTEQSLEPSSDTIPSTTGEPDYERLEPVPQTEKTLAETYVDDAHTFAYLNKGHGISDWIMNKYNYDQQQAGTMWVAGKINDVATQMSFLEATLNEDMYSELDLQKYFFDTNLATARAYAKEKRSETAYGYYRAAQEKALSEGQLTGWYMPAEANYMLSQWAIASEKLKDPNTDLAERNRAGSVKQAVASWFEANNITWRGIECINRMYYLETVRHNKENERLQEQANQIAAAQNAANAAAAASSAALQLREHYFQIAEEELDMGVDLNGDLIIGHGNWDPVDGSWTGDANNFGWYPTQKLWAQHNLDAAFKLWGTDAMKVILDKDYGESYKLYKTSLTTQRDKEIYDANNGNTIIGQKNAEAWGKNKLRSGQEVKVTDEKGNESTLKITDKNNQLYIHYNDDGTQSFFVYDDEGMAYQITQAGGYELSGGTSFGGLIKKQDLNMATEYKPILIKDSEGNQVEMHMGYIDMAGYKNSIGDAKNNELTKEQNNAKTDLGSKGYRVVPGAISTEGINSALVMEKDGKYYDIDAHGNAHEIKDQKKIVVGIHTKNGWEFKHLDGTKLNWTQKIGSDSYDILMLRQMETLGYDSEGNVIKAFVNNDGSVDYIKVSSTITHNDFYGGDVKSNYENITRDEAIKLASGGKYIRYHTLLATQEEFESNTRNYIERTRTEKDPVRIATTDEMIQEAHDSLSETAKKNAEKEVSQHYSTAAGGSVSTPQLDDPTYNFYQDGKGHEYTQHEYRALEDAQKQEIVEAQLGELAKKEIENNKKRYEALFGVKTIEEYLKGR